MGNLLKAPTLAVLVAIWLTAACGGLIAVARYDHRAGASASAASHWPQSTPLEFKPGNYNLVLSVHPQCSCSKATLSELEEILARSGGKLRVHALVALPRNSPEEWRTSSLVEQLRALPDTTVFFDPDSDEAARFGAITSGDCVLFAPRGEKVFHGGITRSRGHVGDNIGKQTVLALVEGHAAPGSETPVFGCSLNAEKSMEARP
jgi:hypothetical protein